LPTVSTNFSRADVTLEAASSGEMELLGMFRRSTVPAEMMNVFTLPDMNC
jgi:hypothetical protein